MTFQGMLKILVNDYKRQYVSLAADRSPSNLSLQEEKMVSITDELARTRNELQVVKEKLLNVTDFHPRDHRTFLFHLQLQLGESPPASTPSPTISLFVQYNGFFNELRDIWQTMTIKDLLVRT